MKSKIKKSHLVIIYQSLSLSIITTSIKSLSISTIDKSGI